VGIYGRVDKPELIPLRRPLLPTWAVRAAFTKLRSVRYSNRSSRWFSVNAFSGSPFGSFRSLAPYSRPALRWPRRQTGTRCTRLFSGRLYTDQTRAIRPGICRADIRHWPVLWFFIALLGQQQVVQSGNRPVVQIRRHRPDAVQGTCLVSEPRRVGRGRCVRAVIPALQLVRNPAARSYAQ